MLWSSLLTTLWSCSRVGSLVRTSRATDVLLPFARCAHAGLGVPNIAAEERLSLHMAAEHNVQKLKDCRLRG
jgi:hypothetical protein